jgi:DNA-binding PadR family transcriptional regulator
MQSKQLIKGTLKTIILKLLNEHEKMYGYEMTQKVKQLSEGQLELTEGALYPMLHKLEAEGFLVAEKVPVGKRVRKYYRLTPAGKAACVSRLEEFEAFVRMMRLILKPGL